MSRAALRTEGLVKRFGKTVALNQVDITVPEGKLVVVLGATGAGKTTLLRTIAGLATPDEGTVHILDEDVTFRQPKDRNVAMIFDNLALYPNLSGMENIAYPLKLRGMKGDELQAHVRTVAAKLRITHVLARLPRTMSGGERQRVALGRALVRDPALFLLDEPFSSLDAMLRLELRAEIRRLQRAEGYSFLFATPDYTEALAIADTVVMLVGGEVRQVATPQLLYESPADRDVARFIGTPEINLIPAEYDPGEGGRLHLAGQTFMATEAVRAAFGHKPAHFEVGLRPEQILLDPDGPGDAAVTDIEPLGLQSSVSLVFGSLTLRSIAPAALARRLAVGRRVRVLPQLDRLVGFDGRSGRRVL